MTRACSGYLVSADILKLAKFHQICNVFIVMSKYTALFGERYEDSIRILRRKKRFNARAGMKTDHSSPEKHIFT
jgi:hypothetical protein